MAIPLIDILIVVGFIGILLWLGFRERAKISLDDYWVNNRSTGTFSVTATMNSTFIGASAIFALAGLALEAGFAVFFIGLSFIFYLILFGIFLAPRIQTLGVKEKIYTFPQALGLRYGRRLQLLSAILSLIVYGLFMGVQFLAIGGLVSLFTDISLIAATIVGGLVITAYVYAGGLRADIRTDILQFLVMLLLVLVFVPLLVIKGGGLEAISNLSNNYLFGFEFLPPAVIIAAFFLIGPTMFASLDVWQRALASRTPQVAKRGMIWAAIFMIPFFLMAALIGIFGGIIYPNVEVNSLIFKTLTGTLPSVLLGVGLAGFFAAVMSTADSFLLILSQTIVNDIYRKNMSPEKVLHHSRLYSLGLGILALIAAIILLDLVTVAVSAVSLQVVMVPAAIGLFFWKRSTATAAFWSIIIGSITTVVALPFLSEQSFLPGFVASAVVFVALSLFTNHSESERPGLYEKI